MRKNKTIFEKIWNAHLVESIEDGPDILYIDRHYIHEVTSPQAFDGLRAKKIKVFRPLQTVGTADHNVPTKDQHLPIREELSRHQVQKLTDNCKEFDIQLYGLNHPYQGIVHVIGPELGLTLPGMTIVCGDSHTSTHGAFGTIAFGIGTSEVEMVLATQCLMQNKPKTMKIQIDGELAKKVTSKDIILYIISKITSSGGTGYFIEYTGSAITSLSMEARMTICNMSIEMGARGGIITPDETTFQYIKEREFAPKGLDFETYKKYWNTLATDEGAIYDKELYFHASDIEPMITYGTNPGMGIKISETIPISNDVPDVPSFKKALAYMGLKEGTTLKGKQVNYVFIGSCTNARIEDLRLVAQYVKGKKKANNVNAWVIPGSKQVEKQAISEGIDTILVEAGFEFRGPGCSACLGMNEDKIPNGEYCISTSNRNFEGRQGPGARTFLASPITAAASAINGFITDPRDISTE
ncbi:MAG: 3-isopropylmalate dehydratase large subunit [Chitinophagaceae bacterium]|nr:3-isopropylmalate dehydratase large subunit [Chitinophagaceae bacterium]